MGMLDIFKLRRFVPREQVKEAKESLNREVHENALARDEFHEAIGALLRDMEKRKQRVAAHVKNHTRPAKS